MSPNNITHFSHQPRICPTLSNVIQPLLNVFYSKPVTCSTIVNHTVQYFLEYALWILLLLAIVKISELWNKPLVREPGPEGREHVNIELTNMESTEGERDVGVSTSLESLVG